MKPRRTRPTLPGKGVTRIASHETLEAYWCDTIMKEQPLPQTWFLIWTWRDTAYWAYHTKHQPNNNDDSTYWAEILP